MATYLMYLPRSYRTCLTLLSKSSGRDRGRTYYNNKNESLVVSKVEKNKNKTMSMANI